MYLSPQELSVIINGIGWELFGGDGRELSKINDSDAIQVNDEELALCKRIADRIDRELGELRNDV